jgi:hypothetical protein
MKRIPIIIFVLVAVAVVCLFAAQKQDCDSRGGILVRGMFGLDCVKAVLP